MHFGRLPVPSDEAAVTMFPEMPSRFAAAWLGLPVALAVFAAAAPRASRAFTRFVSGCLTAADRRPWLITLPVVAMGLVVPLTLRGFPQPRVQDEFSYLLASDTFARGRLANPPHPLWQSFETFHVNQRPFYVSMYQPGIGMALAAGQRLLGHPWLAVWLSAIGLTVAAHWAALAWLTPPWAAAAGLVTAVIVSRGYWLDSYWGGAVPAIGGGLVVGAWPRIRAAAAKDARTTIRATLPLAAGGLLLLFTRPYEGLALVLPVAVGLGASGMAAGSRAAWIGTCAAALGIGLSALAFYNWKTTGSAVQTPYALNLATYHHRKLFVFGADRDPPPVYRYEVMRRMYSDEFSMRPFSSLAIRRHLLPTVAFYGAPLQLFTLTAMPWIFRNRRSRPLLLATGCASVAVLLTVFIRPHYLAPAAVGIAILSMQGFRLASTLGWRGLRIGRVVACGFLVAWLAVASVLGVVGRFRAASPTWVRERSRIAAELEREGGRHLVLVRYGPVHNPHDEWVFNGASQGTEARLLWARCMDPESDARLVRHHAERRAWLIEPDSSFELRPFSAEVIGPTPSRPAH